MTSHRSGSRITHTVPPSVLHRIETAGFIGGQRASTPKVPLTRPMEMGWANYLLDLRQAAWRCPFVQRKRKCGKPRCEEHWWLWDPKR